jgi:adenosine tuberculosinyltransferase
LNPGIDAFQQAPDDEIARTVRAAGSKVCVFPINGTRRWFVLNANQASETGYLPVIEQRHIDLYRLLFDHGIDTLLTPAFGPDLMERGEDYLRMAGEGLARLCTASLFLDFYEQYQVRVRFYGDTRRYLENTPLRFLLDLFDELSERTRDHNRCRLFFGLFANDPAETIAELGVRYYQQYAALPDRSALVSMYYGEYVNPVSFFIGFDRFSAFDMPLLATGGEDLYFTVNPSPDLTRRQLREILFDHLYTRRIEEPDYGSMSPEDFGWMQKFYQCNQEHTVGIGACRGGIWYPLPQVQWPESGDIE